MFMKFINNARAHYYIEVKTCACVIGTESPHIFSVAIISEETGHLERLSNHIYVNPVKRKTKRTRRRNMASPKFEVDSAKVQFNAQKNSLLATYDYQTTKITKTAEGKMRATPFTEYLTFKTDCKVPRVGCMLVGWGGNNGSTLTASVLANRKNLQWRTKDGIQVSN